MIEYLPIVLTGLGLSASLVYYARVLENSNKTRQAQLYNNLFNQSLNNPNWQQKSLHFFSQQWTTAEEFLELFKYGDTENENTQALWSTSVFFEGMVPIFREGLLDYKYLDSTIGGLLYDFWDRMEPILDEVRLAWNEPLIFWGCEYLVNQMRKHKILDH